MGFEKARRLRIPFRGPCAGIEVFDCDGDGREDVLLLQGPDFPFNSPPLPWDKKEACGKIYLFLNQGKGALKLGSSLRFPGDPGSLTFCEPADIDGDGDLDLVVGSRDPIEKGPSGASGKVRNGIGIFRNDGKGNFTLSQVLNSPRGGISCASADLDGDGDLDFVVGSFLPDAGMWGLDYRPFFILQQGEDHRFSIVAKLGEEARPWLVTAVSAEDLDGDGLPEIIIGGSGWMNEPSPIRCYRNLGGMNFEEGKDLTAPIVGVVSNLSFQDFDGDGVDDLAFGVYGYMANAARREGDPVRVLRGSRREFSFAPFPSLPAVFGGPVLPGDIDVDGDVDLVVGGYCWGTEQKIQVLLNEGKKGFRLGRSIETHEDGPFPMALVDIDGDFSPDLIFVTGNRSNRKECFLNIICNGGEGGGD